MEAEFQDDVKNEEDTEQSDRTERDEKSDKDFFTKMLEASGQDDERKNIFIQYRIVNNHGIMASDSAQIEKIYANGQEEVKGKEKKAKRNIFSDESKRNKWLTENYETYSMALMIAVAVFDAMPYMWVMRAAETLHDSFENKDDKEEKRYGITEILSQFGAVICKGELNTYTGLTPIDVVRLEQKTSQETILKYIWIECPQLQDVIMRWLEKCYLGKTISMSKRAGEAMGWLASWDYHYFLNHMVNQIRYKKSISTDMMIAQVVTALEKKKDFQDNVYNLLEKWTKERNVHYLLTGLFVCAGQKDKNDILETIIYGYVDRMMAELQREKNGEYLYWGPDFFAAGMRAFTFYRILIEKIYELEYRDPSPRNTRDICRLFWFLFRIDTQLARYEKKEDAVFIRIAMQDDRAGDQLRYLWQMVWRDRPNRDIFYSLLAEYDKEARRMPGYNLEKFIQKTFGNICEEERQKDIYSKIRRRSDNE